MNWTMFGVLSAILLSIGGGLGKLITILVRNYFDTLSARMQQFEDRLDAHTAKEEVYQEKMLATVAGMKEALIRAEAIREQYVQVGTHLEALRAVDQAIVESRHVCRNELHGHRMENEIKFHELSIRLESLEK